MEQIGLQAILDDKNFQAGLKKYQQGVDSASTKTDGWATKLNNLTQKTLGLNLAQLSAGLVIGATVKYLKAAISDTAAYAKTVGELSIALGVNAEEASQLLQISDDLEIQQTTLKTAFRNLVDEGIQPSIANIMGLADEYQNLPSPVEKAQFAMDKFGAKAGPEMQKLLEKTPEEIKAMADEATAAGLVMSGEGVEAAKAYRLSVDAVGDAMDGLSYKIGQNAMPALTKFNNKLAEMFTRSGSFMAQEQALRQTADTYDEYIAAVQEAMVSTGGMTEEAAEAIVQMVVLTGKTNETIDGIWVLSEAEYEAAKAIKYWKDNAEQTFDAHDYLIQAAKAESDAADEATISWGDYLESLMNAPDIFEEIAEAEEYAAIATAALTAENAKLLLAGGMDGTLTEAFDELALASQELESAHGEGKKVVDELTLAMGEAAANAAQLTKEFIFQKAAAKLNEEDQLALAKAMGLINDLEYQVTQATIDLTDAYTNGQGDADTYAAAMAYLAAAAADGELYLGEVATALDILNGKEVTATINIVTNGYIPPIFVEDYVPGFDYSTLEEGDYEIQAAQGAAFRVPSGYPADSYHTRLGLTSGEGVFVLPAEMMRMLSASPGMAAPVPVTASAPLVPASLPAGGNNINIYFEGTNINNGMDLAATAAFIKTTVKDAIRYG